jgi:hypothetical protein
MRRQAGDFRPRRAMLPLSGASSPDSKLTNVDFPAPLGPISA